MLLGMIGKASKMIVVLCIGTMFMLGVACQLHASPHAHAVSAGDHQDHHGNTSSSVFDDMSFCIVAVVPSIGNLLSLPFLDHDISPHVIKPLTLAVEFDIPPRFSI